MTTPASSGGSSPLRIGGLALLGAGAVAGLIGVASLAGGGSSTTAAPVSTSAETSVAPSVAPTPDAAVPVPVPSFGPGSNAIAAPTTPAAAAAAPAPAATSAPKVVRAPVRVYNNSTMTGLATRAADDFRGQGWAIERIDNYPQGIIPTSTVYFRPSTGEETAARSLGKTFGLRVEPRFQGLDEASPGLIVIVTNDYKGR